MKRLILASLIGLVASGAYASDLSYGGPYSQMKLKLCSDTPPSRSILPDGSLVCDGEENDPNAYCVGGFNYADTDIFNCGAESVDMNDLNGNGRGDAHEDWDGDGIPNGQDPNPYESELSHLDENGNGIPDDIEGIYDELTSTQEILYCNNDDDQCHQMRYAMRDLTRSNQILAAAMRDASLRNVRRNDFNNSIGVLTEVLNTKTRGLLHAVESIDVSGADNSAQIAQIKSFLNDRISETSGTNYTKINQNNQFLQELKSTTADTNSSVKSLPQQINAVHEHMDANKDQVIRAIENNASGGSGLTSQQKNQLRNAAKAHANQKLLKTIDSTLDEVAVDAHNTMGGLGAMAGRLSSVDEKLANMDGRFTQLSNEIAAISSGTSTIDLSGVESSIGALSDKIDGIEGSNNGEELAEISGKLDGLANGMTDIGDLLKGVDASKAGIDGTCIQGGTCQGFYDSAYEGDLSDVLESQLQTMKTSVVDPFVSNFGNIDLSGAKRPNFGLPVPFYGYFSFDDYIDLDWIFGFLRFIFLASTAFYCRQIIFGG
ncbi:hypothetical protein OQJ65_16330 [Vibrio sp. Sgm 22]|uniref:hypothetical protein n=1 Tax=unclassified Vibrio TaxID=2614977 RepID=UPI0022493741|nr:MULTISPECIES: hypothetical protein [unclassified Vibrio]MCX2759900.1 hypothetical protein [Vibrio sp. 14G-20]MCX2776887.1 hypothetical protein [Vibrio sp. Sgm 22]